MRDTRNGGDVVEVALESLLRQWKELDAWLEESAGDLRQADALKENAAEWEERNRDDAGLLQGQRLRDAERLFNKADFREHLSSAHDLVEASKLREREQKWTGRRRRTVLSALLVIVAIFALVASVLWVQQQ